jgi:hypothetical protein
MENLEMTEDFQAFWRVYPRREAKQDALKAWGRLNPSAALVTEILDALAWQTQRDDWTKDDGRYVPLPASWLRGQRWEDEPPKRQEQTRSAGGILRECPHTPRCLARWACGQRQILERQAS